ncbi:MAG: PEP-CTERM sorting domain-containing protein [Syntrophobacteraceae bacterium]
MIARNETGRVFTFGDITTVPGPTTLLLLGAGMSSAGLYRRFRG